MRRGKIKIQLNMKTNTLTLKNVTPENLKKIDASITYIRYGEDESIADIEIQGSLLIDTLFLLKDGWNRRQ